MPSIDQLVVWIIVGLLGGSIAGLLVQRKRSGFGLARNLIIGLIGALIGGFFIPPVWALLRSRQGRDLPERRRGRRRRVVARARCSFVVLALEKIVLIG